MSHVNLSDWIAYVDRLRETDALLSRGWWHGYLNQHPDGYPLHPGHPLRGLYVLARWKNGDGSIVVAADSPEACLDFARRAEYALFGPAALLLHPQERPVLG